MNPMNLIPFRDKNISMKKINDIIMVKINLLIINASTPVLVTIQRLFLRIIEIKARVKPNRLRQKRIKL